MKPKHIAGELALIAIALRAEAHRKDRLDWRILADLLDWIAAELVG